MKHEMHKENTAILVGLLHRLKGRKRTLGHPNQSQHIRPGKPPGQIVIGLMTRLLQLHKRIRDRHNPTIWTTGNQLVQGLRRRTGVPFHQGLTRLFHVGVPKSAAHLLPQHIPSLPSHNLPACCIHQQMEKSIIRCRGRPSKTGLAWPSRFMGRELSGLVEQIPLQRHPSLPSAIPLTRLSHTNVRPEARYLA